MKTLYQQLSSVSMGIVTSLWPADREQMLKFEKVWRTNKLMHRVAVIWMDLLGLEMPLSGGRCWCCSGKWGTPMLGCRLGCAHWISGLICLRVDWVHLKAGSDWQFWLMTEANAGYWQTFPRCLRCLKFANCWLKFVNFKIWLTLYLYNQS